MLFMKYSLPLILYAFTLSTVRVLGDGFDFTTTQSAQK